MSTNSYRIALAIKLDGTATGCLNVGYGQQLHDLLKEASRALLDSHDGPSERSLEIIREQSDRIVKLQDCYIGLEGRNMSLEKDAARWRFARTIFAIEDVERAVEEMRGSGIIEEENIKADAAIDAARYATLGEGTK